VCHFFNKLRRKYFISLSLLTIGNKMADEVFNIEFTYQQNPYVGLVRPLQKDRDTWYSVDLESENQESHVQIIAVPATTENGDWRFECSTGEFATTYYDKDLLWEVGEAIDKYLVGTQNLKPPPVTIGPEDGRTISLVGDTYRILITGQETEGAFATIDMLIPPNGGPGPHAHPNFQESFFVIDGEIEVRSEASVYIAKKGAFVSIPKGGTVHCFKNKTDRTAHLLCMVVPSGLEEFFLAVGQPIAPGTFLAAQPMDGAFLKKVQTLSEKYGQILFPPDYLE
jgi:quercetin dioxygenase-like cupin family protein